VECGKKSVCLCVSVVCVAERKKEREKKKGNRKSYSPTKSQLKQYINIFKTETVNRWKEISSIAQSLVKAEISHTHTHT
jgi:hypothetical protein